LITLAAAILFSRKNRFKKSIGVIILTLLLLLSNSPTITGSLVLPVKQISCENCNLIIIVPEVLRKDHVGLYSDKPYTPNIDNFFRDSWKFNNFYGTCPWTAPTHTSLLTGLYPQNHGVIDKEYYDLLDENVTTLAGFLASKGYFTISLHGEGHLGNESGQTRDFDYEYEIQDFSYLTTEAFKNFLKKTEEQKFFMLISSYDVHDPYVEGPLSSSLNYTGILSSRTPLILGDLFYSSRRGCSVDKGCNIETPFIFDNDEIVFLDEKDLEFYRTVYADNVARMDSNLKSFFNLLETEGLIKGTIIVLAVDHGEELYEHWVGHSQFYDNIIHTPLLIKFPGSQYREIDDPVSNVDLFPTLVSILGYETPENLDGINFLGEKNDYIYGHNVFGNHRYMITNGNQKLILESLEGLGNIELYDLVMDPEEKNNLADRYDLYENELYLRLKAFFS
jgi:arylsulfatase A-like enzyme